MRAGAQDAGTATTEGSCHHATAFVRITTDHRAGRVGIGEPSVVIAVSAPHRADALAACKDAIDVLKESVPVWKKEVYEGGEEWIGKGS
ncbi:MAG TPA: molybdenum cofactor biosynthesis protein MoaE [Gaiellaceae bacterium]|jgi:molybdopterin synthase catalytic subunit